MSLDHLIELSAASGGVLFIMPLLLLVTLTVSFERAWWLARLMSRSRAVIRRVGEMTDLDRGVIEAELARVERHPIGSVLQVPLRFPDERDHARLADRLEEAILREVPRIDRSLWMLDTAVTLAPLLGLLGTIIGMFNAFQVLGRPGSAPTEITGGVAEALIATASGLFIAIIGLIFFNSLQARVRLVIHDLETLKTMLVNRLTGAEEPVQVTRQISVRGI
ncbi:MAG: MotA/TolQ/ExbB proton channel family protein [Telmatospirillum sp.]|nr:MotA/TolQ/ExbB proton channel family protein [Telmatospirillum sp.]